MGSFASPPPTGIQTIDISTLIQSTDPVARKVKADELVEAIRTHGACGIVGHGIPIPHIREAFKWTKRFFELPKAIKSKVNHPDGIVPHRGYSGIGREKCLIYTEEELEAMGGELAKENSKPLDWKEHIDIGSDEEKVHYSLWLPEEDLPGFRSYVTKFYFEAEAVSRAVLNGIIDGLEVEQEAADYFRSIHTGHQNGIRLVHYPSAPESEIDRSQSTWCPAHTDFTTFTLLFQDHNQGLEIEDRLNPGSYFLADPSIEDRLYLTMGDFGAIWTNGYLPASNHRVVIPRPTDGSGITPLRYSMPYFITPTEDGIISPQYTGKLAGTKKGQYATTTVKKHIEFRMAYQIAPAEEV